MRIRLCLKTPRERSELRPWEFFGCVSRLALTPKTTDAKMNGKLSFWGMV
jgi:hypothetical protein